MQYSRSQRYSLHTDILLTVHSIYCILLQTCKQYRGKFQTQPLSLIISVLNIPSLFLLQANSPPVVVNTDTLDGSPYVSIMQRMHILVFGSRYNQCCRYEKMPQTQDTLAIPQQPSSTPEQPPNAQYRNCINRSPVFQLKEQAAFDCGIGSFQNTHLNQPEKYSVI